MGTSLNETCELHFLLSLELLCSIKEVSSRDFRAVIAVDSTLSLGTVVGKQDVMFPIGRLLHVPGHVRGCEGSIGIFLNRSINCQSPYFWF